MSMCNLYAYNLLGIFHFARISFIVIGDSSNGRTADSDSASEGSKPSPPASHSRKPLGQAAGHAQLHHHRPRSRDYCYWLGRLGTIQQRWRRAGRRRRSCRD